MSPSVCLTRRPHAEASDSRSSPKSARKHATGSNRLTVHQIEDLKPYAV
jgi:hypothetical protein